MAANTPALPPARREVLGLLLVLASLAQLVSGMVTAKAFALMSGGDASFGSDVDIESGFDLEVFLRTLAITATGYHVVLLVGGLVLASVRPWDVTGRAGRWACSILLPLGLVIAALGVYATYLVLTESPQTVLSAFVQGGTGPDRFGAALLPLASVAVAGYVAWGAFCRLPFTVDPDGWDDEDDDREADPDLWASLPASPPMVGSDAVGDAEEA